MGLEDEGSASVSFLSFFLSDSKGSLEPHKPGKHQAEIAALTHILNISN